MPVDIRLGDKTLIALGVVFFSVLSLYSGVAYVAEYSSGKVEQPLLSGVVSDPETSQKGTSFKIKNGDTVVGTAVVSSVVKNGDAVRVVNLRDSLWLPPLYAAREWSEIRVGGEKVLSSETHVPLLVSGLGWLAAGVVLGGSITLKKLKRLTAKRKAMSEVVAR